MHLNATKRLTTNVQADHGAATVLPDASRDAEPQQADNIGRYCP